jgi:voltage-dependent potassium channel beta subunit
MEYRFLGNSGLKVSALSFGAWITFGDQIDEEVALECMESAYSAGVNFFDNAEVYAQGQAETFMGNAIKKAGWTRSDLVISTKIFWGGEGPNDRGLSWKHIIEGTEKSLDRLQLDYVDLIFCHRPDLHTPIEETVRAMNHIINQGKAFYWGTSEWSARQITEAYGIAHREHMIPPLMEQPQYNMFHRERVEVEYAPLYKEFGYGTTIWSPLASGLLTGKYNEGVPEGTRASLDGYVKLMEPIAQEVGCTMAQLALAWCLKNPNVSTVITGASCVEQVEENLQALDFVEWLTDEKMGRIENILDNKPEPEHDWR